MWEERIGPSRDESASVTYRKGWYIYNNKGWIINTMSKTQLKEALKEIQNRRDENGNANQGVEGIRMFRELYDELQGILEREEASKSFMNRLDSI